MLRYVTSNPGKAREATAYLDDAVEAVELEYPEIQADDLEPIATAGAEDAYERLEGTDPVIVDDAGLFIDALSGFPGPYSSFVEDTVGIERVAELALAEPDRTARFRCVIAYYDGERSMSFSGGVRGRIVSPRGTGGFGYDPIFEHGDRTFAEMDAEEKNARSHRGRALERFAAWYDEDGDQSRGSRSVPE